MEVTDLPDGIANAWASTGMTARSSDREGPVLEVEKNLIGGLRGPEVSPQTNNHRPRSGRCFSPRPEPGRAFLSQEPAPVPAPPASLPRPNIAQAAIASQMPLPGLWMKVVQKAGT
jgi:hypothetical protein